MSERRRMIMKGPGELILDGLQFWFDGKNNLQGGGFSQSATEWYPYIKNSLIPDSYYLVKQGSGSWNSNGGFVASGSYGYFTNNVYSPFYYLPNVSDFTFVCCLGNLTNTDGIQPIGGNCSGGNGNGRWYFFINDTASNYTFSIYTDTWQIYSAAKRTAVSTKVNTIIITRKGTSISVYINGQLDSTISATSTYLGNSEFTGFSLGAYDTVSTKIDAPYYSCQMYNRALTMSEVMKSHLFITKRYGLI